MMNLNKAFEVAERLAADENDRTPNRVLQEAFDRLSRPNLSFSVRACRCREILWNSNQVCLEV
mgnify:FL=1